MIERKDKEDTTAAETPVQTETKEEEAKKEDEKKE